MTPVHAVTVAASVDGGWVVSCSHCLTLHPYPYRDRGEADARADRHNPARAEQVAA